jgi:hypothetical protein
MAISRRRWFFHLSCMSCVLCLLVAFSGIVRFALLWVCGAIIRCDNANLTFSLTNVFVSVCNINWSICHHHLDFEGREATWLNSLLSQLTLCVLFQSSRLQNIWSIMAFVVGQALTNLMVYIIFILYLTSTCLARWQALELHYVEQKVWDPYHGLVGFSPYECCKHQRRNGKFCSFVFSFSLQTSLCLLQESI